MPYSEFTAFYYILLLGFVYIWNVERCKNYLKLIELFVLIKLSQIMYLTNISILQTGHITLNSTPDQQLENHSTKYHRQQPLYNTLEFLMMGIVVPETY